MVCKDKLEMIIEVVYEVIEVARRESVKVYLFGETEVGNKCPSILDPIQSNL